MSMSLLHALNDPQMMFFNCSTKMNETPLVMCGLAEKLESSFRKKIWKISKFFKTCCRKKGGKMRRTSVKHFSLE